MGGAVLPRRNVSDPFFFRDTTRVFLVSGRGMGCLCASLSMYMLFEGFVAAEERGRGQFENRSKSHRGPPRCSQLLSPLSGRDGRDFVVGLTQKRTPRQKIREHPLDVLMACDVPKNSALLQQRARLYRRRRHRPGPRAVRQLEQRQRLREVFPGAVVVW